MSEGTRLIQRGLKEDGFDPGPVDGVAGRRTLEAFSRWAEAQGSKRAVSGAPVVSGGAFPWIAEGRKVMGLHEARDNAKLVAWLRSDGKRLGDPAKLPWCGDYVETAIKLSLPDEPFPGPVGENPYWARNWLHFGVRCDAVEGAVGVFERGPQSGHVGFLVGQGAGVFYVLGGNQGDTVSVVPIARGRLLGARWPKTFPNPERPLPKMDGGKISINEV